MRLSSDQPCNCPRYGTTRGATLWSRRSLTCAPRRFSKPRNEQRYDRRLNHASLRDFSFEDTAAHQRMAVGSVPQIRHERALEATIPPQKQFRQVELPIRPKSELTFFRLFRVMVWHLGSPTGCDDLINHTLDVPDRHGLIRSATKSLSVSAFHGAPTRFSLLTQYNRQKICEEPRAQVYGRAGPGDRAIRLLRPTSKAGRGSKQ